MERTSEMQRQSWEGPTYYGRSQLKPAPFNNWVVGAYIFIAGLSGGASLISAVAEFAGRRKAGRREPEALDGVARRGRYLAMLAPTIGPLLLISDLHTPKRFYNMLRVAKGTSAMSIGTWILMSFSAFASLGAVAQIVADRFGWRWPRRAARIAQVPAAATGAGLATYTASLLASTSTPLWAAAPGPLAARFGASSIASAAAALSLGERSAGTRRTLDSIAVTALATELAATTAAHARYEQKGVAEALQGGWGKAEEIGANRLGTLVPLGLYATSLVLSRRPGRLSSLASVAVLGGSALMRVAFMGAGDESARRPEVSFRFSQPRNLPRT